MSKFRLKRKHILPLILLVICLASIIFSIYQVRQVDRMENQIRTDLKDQTVYLLQACGDLSRNLYADKHLVHHFIVQLQDRLYNLDHHVYLYRQFSNSPDYDYFDAYRIGDILGQCNIISGAFDSLTEEEQERFLSFLAQLTEQIQLAFSYQNEPADINEQFAHVMAGWRQLDTYMKENNVLEYAQENIFGLEK